MKTAIKLIVEAIICVALIILVIGFLSTIGHAETLPNEHLTPRMIEKFVLSIENGMNIYDEDLGDELECRYGIKKSIDHRWTCKDRAELAIKLAVMNGYKYEQKYWFKSGSKTLFGGKDQAHTYVVIFDNGEAIEILNGPPKDAWARGTWARWQK